jgi:hypothetical protein
MGKFNCTHDDQTYMCDKCGISYTCDMDDQVDMFECCNNYGCNVYYCYYCAILNGRLEYNMDTHIIFKMDDNIPKPEEFKKWHNIDEDGAAELMDFKCNKCIKKDNLIKEIKDNDKNNYSKEEILQLIKDLLK